MTTPEAADATSADQLAEQTDNDPTPADGPQDLPQEPVAEDDVEDDEPDDGEAD